MKNYLLLIQVMLEGFRSCLLHWSILVPLAKKLCPHSQNMSEMERIMRESHCVQRLTDTAGLRSREMNCSGRSDVCLVLSNSSSAKLSVSSVLQHGPVVILNAAAHRCDALIVLANVDHVVHVPLPYFTLQRSACLQNMLEKLLGHARATSCNDERKGDPTTRGSVSWESLLSTLWKGVVHPVLEALAFSVRDVMYNLK